MCIYISYIFVVHTGFFKKAQKKKKHIKADICTLWDAKQWQIKANFHKTPGLKYIFHPWAVGVTAVPPSQLHGTRQTSTILQTLSSASCCRVLPSKQRENMLIITMSTERSHEETTQRLGINKLVCRHLGLLSVCLPSTSWRRRHSTSTGQAELIRLLCSLPQRTVRFRLQINLLGVKGES